MRCWVAFCLSMSLAAVGVPDGGRKRAPPVPTPTLGAVHGGSVYAGHWEAKTFFLLQAPRTNEAPVTRLACGPALGHPP